MDRISYEYPPVAPPGILPWDSNSASYHKVWIISTIISAMVYGGVLSLALSCIRLLIKNSNESSRCMCKFFLLYVAFMVTISTIYTITMVIGLLNLNRFGTPLSDPGWTYPEYQPYAFPNGYVGIICVTVATWGADGMMASI